MPGLRRVIVAANIIFGIAFGAIATVAFQKSELFWTLFAVCSWAMAQITAFDIYRGVCRDELKFFESEQTK